MASISFRSHPSQEAWENYALRQLPEEEIAPMEEHLLVCHQCRDTLDEVDKYILLMKAGTAELVHAPVASKLRGFWRAVWPQSALPRFTLASAAATACLAIALYVNAPKAGVVAAALSERGNSVTPVVPAHHPLDLKLHVPDAMNPSRLRVDVADFNGEKIWSGQPQVSPGKVKVALSKGLSKGLYWVRLYDGPDLAYEYALRAD